MIQSKVWAVVLVILVLSAGVYLTLLTKDKAVSPLEAPAISYFPDYFEGKPAVQITWDYGAAPNFNIYRSTDGQNWQIFAEKFPQSAHAAVDANLPKNATTLYYRVVGVEENGKEGVSSPISSVEIPNQVSKIDTSIWKTYTNTEYGFEFKYLKDWKMMDAGLGQFFYSPSIKNPKDEIGYCDHSSRCDQKYFAVSTEVLDEQPVPAAEKKIFNGKEFSVYRFYYDSADQLKTIYEYQIPNGVKITFISYDEGLKYLDQALDSFRLLK